MSMNSAALADAFHRLHVHDETVRRDIFVPMRDRCLTCRGCDYPCGNCVDRHRERWMPRQTANERTT